MKTIKEIKDRIQNGTSGYFYADNCRIDWGDKGWYVKVFKNNKITTNLVDESLATILIGGSLTN